MATRFRLGGSPKYSLPRLQSYALRALGLRIHSREEMRRKLAARAGEAEFVDAVMERLDQAGLLDDRQFAVEFARFRAHRRRLGRIRIAAELRQRGVADEFISEALDAALPTEEDEAVLVRRRITKRLESGRARTIDAKMFRSLYSALLRAGFSSAIIRDELFRRPEFSELGPMSGRSW